MYLVPRIRMMRPGNAVMSAIGVAVGILLAADAPDVALVTWLGAPLAAFLIAAFGNVLNDITDRDLDKAAHPERPLPSGDITVRDASSFAALLLVFGLFEAWVAGGAMLLLFATGVAALLALYEKRLKAAPLVGNVVVGVLVGATVVFGALAAVHAGAAERVPAAAWVLAAMAALTNVARELWKDLEDAAADAGHRRTFAVIAAPGAVHAVAVAAVLIAVAGTAFPGLRDDWPRGASWLLWAADVVFLAAIGLGVPAPGRGQRVLKAAMLLALLAFLLGALLPPQWP